MARRTAGTREPGRNQRCNAGLYSSRLPDQWYFTSCAARSAPSRKNGSVVAGTRRFRMLQHMAERGKAAVARLSENPELSQLFRSGRQ